MTIPSDNHGSDTTHHTSPITNISSSISLREEANRKYRTKRLQEGYIFLKTITFDGECHPEHDDDDVFIDDNINEESTPVPSFILENDTSLCTLVANSNCVPRFNRCSLSASNFASLHDDDGRNLHQKVHFDSERNEPGKSRSTFLNLKELAKQLIHVASSPACLKMGNRNLTGKRVILVTPHHVPVHVFSVVSYKKPPITNDSSRRASLTPQHHHSMCNTCAIFIEDIDLGDGKREVSYKHLLNPAVYIRKRIRSESEIEPQIDSSAGSIHEVEVVLLDDPELTSGKHRTVLNLPSYMVSIIQYAKPAKVKKDINERFKEEFPNVTITLTKLRSIKAEMICIGQKLSLDLAIIACSFLYFEKTILKTRITKHNRKYIAGACLLLSIKFSDDSECKNIRSCIEAITDQFRLSNKDLLSCELQVLILLEFSLLAPMADILPLYKRLEASAA